MIVNQTTRRGFERRCQRTKGLGDIVVDWRMELGRLITREERRDEKQELRLTFVEVAKDPAQDPDVTLPLPDQRRGRMFPGRRQPRAIGRAPDLDEPFRPAADCADLLVQCRTAPPGPTGAAKRTHHRGSLHASRQNLRTLGVSPRQIWYTERLLTRTKRNGERENREGKVGV